MAKNTTDRIGELEVALCVYDELISRNKNAEKEWESLISSDFEENDLWIDLSKEKLEFYKEKAGALINKYNIDASDYHEIKKLYD